MWGAEYSCSRALVAAIGRTIIHLFHLVWLLCSLNSEVSTCNWHLPSPSPSPSRREFFEAMSEVLEGSKGLSTEGTYFVNAVLCSLDYEQFHKLMTQNMQAVMSREMPMGQFGDRDDY